MKRIYKASPDLEKAKRAGNRKKENLRINVSKVDRFHNDSKIELFRNSVNSQLKRKMEDIA